jgi:hypothetical protein
MLMEDLAAYQHCPLASRSDTKTREPLLLFALTAASAAAEVQRVSCRNIRTLQRDSKKRYCQGLSVARSPTRTHGVSALRGSFNDALYCTKVYGAGDTRVCVTGEMIDRGTPKYSERHTALPVLLCPP